MRYGDLHHMKKEWARSVKRIYMIILTLALVLTTSATAFAEEKITVLVNGKQVVSDVPAVIVSSRTMLPFRAVFNALEVSDDSIKWNPDSRCIEVNSGDKYIFLVVGSVGALVNNQLITLDAAPYIENNRTFVPLRFVSEALGAEVHWNQDTKTVSIIKSG